MGFSTNQPRSEVSSTLRNIDVRLEILTLHARRSFGSRCRKSTQKFLKPRDNMRTDLLDSLISFQALYHRETDIQWPDWSVHRYRVLISPSIVRQPELNIPILRWLNTSMKFPPRLFKSKWIISIPYYGTGKTCLTLPLFKSSEERFVGFV